MSVVRIESPAGGDAMKYKPENPPAFPPHPGSQETAMTLRDFFAGHALASISAIHSIQVKGPRDADLVFAAAAYKMADAMLAERERTIDE